MREELKPRSVGLLESHLASVECRMEDADAAWKVVRLELQSAVEKFPPFNSPHEGYAVILEELDELWDEVKANNTQSTRLEAVQVAAMAIRFLTDIR